MRACFNDTDGDTKDKRKDNECDAVSHQISLKERGGGGVGSKIFDNKMHNSFFLRYNPVPRRRRLKLHFLIPRPRPQDWKEQQTNRLCFLLKGLLPPPPSARETPACVAINRLHQLIKTTISQHYKKYTVHICSLFKKKNLSRSFVELNAFWSLLERRRKDARRRSFALL